MSKVHGRGHVSPTHQPYPQKLVPDLLAQESLLVLLRSPTHDLAKLRNDVARQDAVTLEVVVAVTAVVFRLAILTVNHFPVARARSGCVS